MSFQNSPKKLNFKSVKKFVKTVRIWFSCQNAQIIFFIFPAFAVSKMQCCWKNTLTGTGRSWTSNIKGNSEKLYLYWSSSMLQLNFPQKSEDLILRNRSQPESFYVFKSSICKWRWFCVSRPYHHSLKTMKNATTFDMCRYSNLTFWATAGLIHQWKSQLKDLFLLEEEAKRKPLFLRTAP